jgi:NTE family protein
MNVFNKPRIALALSGGGFRASVFHLGVMRRLAELGWLPRIDAISTVSGGSILGAYMALRWKELEKTGCDWPGFEETVVKPFLRLITTQNFIQDWAFRIPLVLLRRLVNRTYTRTTLAAELLSDRFYDGKFCTALPERPFLVLNATSLIAMRAWRFTRGGMGDSRHGHAKWGDHPLTIGECVGASAAFPPVFPPVRISARDYEFSGPVYGEPRLNGRPFVAVSDGGVYDNLGVEVLWKPTKVPGEEQELGLAEFLVVSDAGYPAQHRFRTSGLPGLGEALLLYRVDTIAREQVSALRRRMLVGDFKNRASHRNGTLVMLGSHIDRIPNRGGERYFSVVGRQFRIPDELISKIQRVRTNLDRFGETECTAIMYHAYSMTDAFLWAHRDTCPDAYKVAPNPDPPWKIEFSAERIAEWSAALD